MGRVVPGRAFSIKIFAKINIQIIKNEFSIPDHSSRLTATSATDQQGAGGNYYTARQKKRRQRRGGRCVTYAEGWCDRTGWKMPKGSNWKKKKKRKFVLIFRNIFLVSDSPRAALHDPQFKIMLMSFWFTCDVTVTGLLYSFSSSTPHLEWVYTPRTKVTTCHH